MTLETETVIRLIAQWILNEIPTSSVDMFTNFLSGAAVEDNEAAEVATALLAELDAK